MQFTTFLLHIILILSVLVANCVEGQAEDIRSEDEQPGSISNEPEEYAYSGIISEHNQPGSISNEPGEYAYGGIISEQNQAGSISNEPEEYAYSGIISEQNQPGSISNEPGKYAYGGIISEQNQPGSISNEPGEYAYGGISEQNQSGSISKEPGEYAYGDIISEEKQPGGISNEPGEYAYGGIINEQNQPGSISNEPGEYAYGGISNEQGQSGNISDNYYQSNGQEQSDGILGELEQLEGINNPETFLDSSWILLWCTRSASPRDFVTYVDGISICVQQFVNDTDLPEKKAETVQPFTRHSVPTMPPLVGRCDPMDRCNLSGGNIDGDTDDGYSFYWVGWGR